MVSTKEREVNESHEMAMKDRAEAMMDAIKWFGVEPTPKIISMISSINLFHYDLCVDDREIGPLRAICGEPAIYDTVEEGEKE